MKPRVAEVAFGEPKDLCFFTRRIYLNFHVVNMCFWSKGEMVSKLKQKNVELVSSLCISTVPVQCIVANDTLSRISNNIQSTGLTSFYPPFVERSCNGC